MNWLYRPQFQLFKPQRPPRLSRQKWDWLNTGCRARPTDRVRRRRPSFRPGVVLLHNFVSGFHNTYTPVDEKKLIPSGLLLAHPMNSGGPSIDEVQCGRTSTRRKLRFDIRERSAAPENTTKDSSIGSIAARTFLAPRDPAGPRFGTLPTGFAATGMPAGRI